MVSAEVFSVSLTLNLNMDPTDQTARKVLLISLCCFQYAHAAMGTKIPEVNLGKEFPGGNRQGVYIKYNAFYT